MFNRIMQKPVLFSEINGGILLGTAFSKREVNLQIYPSLNKLPTKLNITITLPEEALLSTITLKLYFHNKLIFADYENQIMLLQSILKHSEQKHESSLA